MIVLNVQSGNSMPTLTQNERRRRTLRNRVRRSFTYALLDIEMETAKKVLTIILVGMAISVASAQSYFIAVPPPIIQNHFAVTLPGYAWMVLLLLGIGWQFGWFVGKQTCNKCVQRDGAFFLFFVTTMLSGPTWLKLPVFSVMVMFTAMAQGVLSARLIHACPPRWLETFFEKVQR